MLPAARTARRWLNFLTSPAFRRAERERKEQFLEFRRRYGKALGERLHSPERPRRRALVVSVGLPGAELELGLVKALELAGFDPVILTGDDPWPRKYFELGGLRALLTWSDFTDRIGTSPGGPTSIESFEQLLSLHAHDARVGRFAASTALRQLRTGTLDVRSPRVQRHLEQQLAASAAAAAAAAEIVGLVRPELVLFADRGYTPHGQLFDICLQAGLDAITWNAAHTSNALMLKRYTLQNRDQHPSSLSEASWLRLQAMDWAEGHRQRLLDELYRSYASGDWYGEVGTQFNRQLLSTEQARQALGLDPARRWAVVFPHILWDGTFFWGKDLFDSYEEWFVETVRAACANDRVNWLIKVHPANIVKDARDNVRSEPSEVAAIRKHIGALPPHVSVIPAESEVSTFSLYGLTDYCLTVRGTVGIEAALFGIPVLTAGTGRFDRKGFTIDADSREQYLENLARVQDIPSLSPGQRELAERFAYGIFVLRPLRLQTVTLEYERDARASLKTRIAAATRADWLNAPDLRALAEWFSHREHEDFLAPDPLGAEAASAAASRRSGASSP